MDVPDAGDISQQPDSGALNPLSGLIDTFRAIMLPAQSIRWDLLGISMLTTLVTLGVAIAYFRSTERRFADIV
jgi:ABC-type polysaccharide/polyol phosphate export permease